MAEGVSHGGRYVVVELRGKLGNQLFEFASGLGIASALDAGLLFDPRAVPAEDLLLPAVIGERFRVATPAQIARAGRYPWADRWRPVLDPFWKRAVNASRHVRSRSAASHSGQGTGFHPEYLALDPPVHVCDYLQFTGYFDAVVDAVIDAIRLPDVRARFPAELGRPVVGVSFRRTDFRPANRLPLAYYERAIPALAQHVDLANATLVMFGEDRDFLRLARPWLEQFAPVYDAYDAYPDVLHHLSMLTQCDHAIMANSTFAWWGAWLGDARRDPGERVVIVPDSYGVGPGRIPPGWRVLAVDAGSTPGGTSGRAPGGDVPAR